MVTRAVIDTIIAEAGGEGDEGITAAAWAIQQRAAARNQSIDEVVRSGFDGFTNPGSGAVRSQQDPAMRARVEQIMRGVQDGSIPNPVPGADHFLSGDVMPSWARGMQHVATIGGHRFYASGNVPRTAQGAPRPPADIPEVASELSVNRPVPPRMPTPVSQRPARATPPLPAPRPVRAAEQPQTYPPQRLPSLPPPSSGAPRSLTRNEQRADNGQTRPPVAPRPAPAAQTPPTQQQAEAATGFRLGGTTTRDVQVANPAYERMMQRVRQGELELQGISPSGQAMSRDAKARYDEAVAALAQQRAQLAALPQQVTVQQTVRQPVPAQPPTAAPVSAPVPVAAAVTVAPASQRPVMPVGWAAEFGSTPSRGGSGARSLVGGSRGYSADGLSKARR